MTALHRSLGCLGLLVAIAGCGQTRSTAPPSTAASPSVSGGKPSVAPSPIVHPLREEHGTAILEPGTYVLDLFPVDLAFDIPDGDPPGWYAGTSTANSAVVLWFTPPEITYEFAFSTADNVYVDPCNADAGELEPPIGPSADELVAALSNLPAFHVTAPVDVTVGAFSGKEIGVTALDSGAACPEVIAFRAGDEVYDLNSGRTEHMHVLEVDGVRIVMRILEPTGLDPAAEAELHLILDSIRIDPLP